MGKKLRKTIFGLCSLTALVHGYNQLVFKYLQEKNYSIRIMENI